MLCVSVTLLLKRSYLFIHVFGRAANNIWWPNNVKIIIKPNKAVRNSGWPCLVSKVIWQWLQCRHQGTQILYVMTGVNCLQIDVASGHTSTNIPDFFWTPKLIVSRTRSVLNWGTVREYLWVPLPSFHSYPQVLFYAIWNWFLCRLDYAVQICIIRLSVWYFASERERDLSLSLLRKGKESRIFSQNTTGQRLAIYSTLFSPPPERGRENERLLKITGSVLMTNLIGIEADFN